MILASDSGFLPPDLPGNAVGGHDVYEKKELR